jgi:hypothetical protein
LRVSDDRRGEPRQAIYPNLSRRKVGS